MSKFNQPVQVIGGGLAGTEAAWQIAQAGVPVVLHEMRPQHLSPAHHTEHLAELVCSNSFGAQSTDRASGLLHEELRRLGSIVIGKADEHAVPAGGALAVDRAVFSRDLTETLASHPLIRTAARRSDRFANRRCCRTDNWPVDQSGFGRRFAPTDGDGISQLF
jgi:methylenetetrahydrofolate--tRNA-(uracil-5-)-methyltransferase